MPEVRPHEEGETEHFVCPDCKEFSKIVKVVFEEVDSHMNTARTVDPRTNRILQLLADSSFIDLQEPANGHLLQNQRLFGLKGLRG